MSTKHLEDFIDDKYKNICLNNKLEKKPFMKKSTDTMDPQVVSKNQQTKQQTNEKKKKRKRQRLTGSTDGSASGSSNVFQDSQETIDYDASAVLSDLPDLPDLPHLTDSQNADILGTLSAWLGEMNTQMQESFNKRFDEAIERVKEEVMNHANSSELNVSLSSQAKDIDDLLKDNEELRNRCRVLEGRVTRAESELHQLKEEQLIQQARSMRDNVKFFNIPETENENCEMVVRRFLINEMKVGRNDMEKIHFERVHRTGKYVRNSNNNRVIVAKVSPEGKQTIFRHIKNLDKSKRFAVSEQLPREMSERKKQLLPAYKQAKQAKKDVKWALDKLVVDGKVKTVRQDKVDDINYNTMDKAITLQEDIKHSPPHTHQGNTFQGHRVKVSSRDDIIPSLHALYADDRVARAKHNVYAYRLKSGDGFIEHYHDDGEWGAGAKLLELLQENDVVDTLVCSSRWYGESPMGRNRFDFYINAVRDALQLQL